MPLSRAAPCCGFGVVESPNLAPLLAGKSSRCVCRTFLWGTMGHVSPPLTLWIGVYPPVRVEVMQMSQGGHRCPLVHIAGVEGSLCLSSPPCQRHHII